MGPGGGGVDWVSAISVLVFGVVVGTILVWRMRAAAQGPADAPESALAERDLHGKRDALLRQLAELDDTAAKRSPEQLARERYDLELETARVLQAIDGLPSAPAPSSSELAADPADASESRETAPEGSEGSPALRGFLWSTGAMLALAGLVFFVTQAARPREPGGSPTGDLPQQAGARPESTDVQAVRDHLQQNPDDLQARLELARLMLSQQQDMMAVWDETQYVLERDPGNPRALTYQAIVRLAMGQPDIARGMVEEAIAANPHLIEAYTTLMMAQQRLGEPEAAAATLAEAQRQFPAEAEGLGHFAAQMGTSAGGPGPAEENPHASLPPPDAPSGAPPGGTETRTPRAAGPKAVAGVLDLDPALSGQVSGVVFLILREAAGGPPLAVQRLTPASFPFRFEIGEDDSMTGEALPDRVLVDVRLDTDGDPMTRLPADPRATSDSVALGSGDVSLILRREN